MDSQTFDSFHVLYWFQTVLVLFIK